MKENELIQAWKAEEEIAHIHGWDFSHIDGRYMEDTNFPWNYRQVIGEYLTSDMKLLDIDTGGGEFLLSLRHLYENTAATENYLPNVQLCKETLLPLGINFRQADGKGKLPFEDASFDVVINRHGDFNPREICKSGLHWYLFNHCTCLYCRRYECYLSNRTIAFDGCYFDSRWNFIYQLPRHLSAQRLAGLWRNADCSIHGNFCCWIYRDLGDHLFHNQKEYGKAQ